MIELRTKSLERDERRAMYRWLIANCKHKVLICGYIAANGKYTNPPQARLDEVEDNEWAYSSTIRFGGQVDAVLFKVTKWCR